MNFIRFVLGRKHPESGVEEGVFRLAYKLRKDNAVPAHDRQTLTEIMSWFDTALPVPRRFNRSKSKGHYRRATRGITWFRETAMDHLSKMHIVKSILESQGHPVDMIIESRIGYIVYEDEVQVVAEPFAETRTGR